VADTDGLVERFQSDFAGAWRRTAEQLRAFWAEDSGTSLHLAAADSLDEAASRITFLEAQLAEAKGALGEAYETLVYVREAADDAQASRAAAETIAAINARAILSTEGSEG
jgi:hypothetical protein